MNVKKLDAPKFSGSIREYPTFRKDYMHYMEPIYGKDSYALRSCLTDEAVETILGVDDDYQKMWMRLDMVYGDTEKVVDSVMCDIKSLTLVKENDSSGMITMINIVERCWLDLRKLRLEEEMNTSTMTSVIERLLLSTQKREWTLFKQNYFSASSQQRTGKFELLLSYLSKERDALEYMNDRMREYNPSSKAGVVNISPGEEGG